MPFFHQSTSARSFSLWLPRFFSLLISTFSLLIALFRFLQTSSKSFRLPCFRFTERSTTVGGFLFQLTASVSFLVSCISGAKILILYVVTRFFTDGCFQAHRQVVFGSSLPFALRTNFETLSVDLGCFPLNVQYLSTAVGLHSWFYLRLFTVCTGSVHFDMPSLVQSFTTEGFRMGTA